MEVKWQRQQTRRAFAALEDLDPFWKSWNPSANFWLKKKNENVCRSILSQSPTVSSCRKVADMLRSHYTLTGQEAHNNTDKK